MKQQSRTKGVVISYLSTIARMLVSFLAIPLYLRKLGLDEYGFYQYIFSIASYVTILDFGISAVINTFSYKYRELGDNAGVENVMFYTAALTVIGAAIIAAFGVVIIICAPGIFGAAIEERVDLARQLLCLMIAELIMLVIQHYFEGVILAAEKYITLRAIDLIQVILRCGITLLLLFSNIGVFSIAIGDFIGVALCLSFEFVYCKRSLKLKAKFHYKDQELLSNIIKLSVALCLQSLISFLNSSIDKFVLGRYLTTAAVTIYSLSLTFSMVFDEIATAIQRLYLPQVVKLVSSNASGEEMTDFVITPGRYQFMLCGGVLGGFILFGRHFISLWSGPETVDAWNIALYLMVPSVLPLIQNVCLSILTAMNKRMFRSYVLGAMAVINLFLTIYLVKKIGLMGAPIGTFISLVLGNNIAMNLYYKKVIGINVIRLFKGILKGVLPAACLAILVSIPLTLFGNNSIFDFAFDCMIFLVIYGGFLWLLGMNEDEKNRVRYLVKKWRNSNRKTDPE